MCKIGTISKPLPVSVPVWQHREDKWWSPELRNYYKQEMEACAYCDLEDSDCDSSKINEYCLPSYLLWASPFIAAMAAAFFGVLSFFLSYSVANKVGEKGTVAVKLFVMFCLMLVVGMWIGAEIASSEGGISNVVEVFSAAGMVIVGGILISTVGWNQLMEKMNKMAVVKMLSKSLMSDWVWAMFVIVCGPFYAIFLLFAFLNQLLRRTGLPCMKPLETDDEASYCFTAFATRQLRTMRRWSWTSLLN